MIIVRNHNVLIAFGEGAVPYRRKQKNFLYSYPDRLWLLLHVLCVVLQQFVFSEAARHLQEDLNNIRVTPGIMIHLPKPFSQYYFLGGAYIRNFHRK